MMKEVKVNKKGVEYTFLVDADDWDKYSAYDWTVLNGYLATRSFGKYILWHRLIMDCHRGDNVLVDHIDTNIRNNQKSNLRRANKFQNQANRSQNANQKLARGIVKLPSGNYRVRVQVENERVSVGTFPTLEEALEIRNSFAKKVHKEFYNPGFIVNNS